MIISQCIKMGLVWLVQVEAPGSPSAMMLVEPVNVLELGGKKKKKKKNCPLAASGAVSLVSASRRGWARSVCEWAGPAHRSVVKNAFFGEAASRNVLTFSPPAPPTLPRPLLRQCVYVQCLCTSLSPSSSSSCW